MILTAGGDGTLHYSLNAAMRTPEIENLTLGHIALGSGNSFLRPYKNQKIIAGVPLKADYENAGNIDIGRVTYEGDIGSTEVRYFIANASFGLLAQANSFFNNPDPLSGAIKKYSTDVAIYSTFIRSLMKYVPEPMEYRLNQKRYKKKLLNLQILKCPYFAGDLYYPLEYAPGSGSFEIVESLYHSRWQALQNFLRLSAGAFKGLKDFAFEKAKVVEVESEKLLPMELDGELIWGKKFKIECLPQKISFCQ